MKILVVDDDPELLPLVAFALRQSGYFALEAKSGEEALELARRELPDLIVLDVNLPGIDGFSVCRALREAQNRTPVLLLTVRGDERDLVEGLDQGADDFLTKPFSPRTLLARVRALLRRAGMERAGNLEVGGLRLDEQSQVVRLPGREAIRLTQLEFRLLQLLAANAGHSVPAERILSHVWGAGASGDRQHLKQLVHRLRQKLEQDPAEPRVLRTEPGIGYRLGAAGELEPPAPGSA